MQVFQELELHLWSWAGLECTIDPFQGGTVKIFDVFQHLIML